MSIKNKQTIAFCIDDNKFFLPLLRVAIRSLRKTHGYDYDAVCIYAGEDKQLIQDIEREDLKLIRYKPVLSKDKMPKNCQHCIGCYLKLELALVPELEHLDEILYCDCDTIFMRPLDELFKLNPAYMAMAREQSAPFYHKYEQLEYIWRDKKYVIKMPFPIWTYNSGVLLYNLAKLRKYDLIHNFLAFSLQNADKIGNHDQSLLNYFFGKKISKLPDKYNYGPYRYNALQYAIILHFHGPKPWDVHTPTLKDLRVNDFDKARFFWRKFLTTDELSLTDALEQGQKNAYAQ